MRFTKKSREYKFKEECDKYCKWHKWFAWYPIRIKIDDNSYHTIWLETVGRKGKVYQSGGYDSPTRNEVGNWEYCLIEDAAVKALKDD